MTYTYLRQAAILLLIMAGAACSKKTDPGPLPASLTLVNAIPDSGPLVTNFGGTSPITWYNAALMLNYGLFYSTQQLGINEGKQPLVLFQYPDTLAHSTPLYNLTLSFAPGDIRTLFLTGTVADPDTLFVRDEPLIHATTDSTLGIRFVNLSPGSEPVSVHISGQSSPIAASLPYKGITPFTALPAKKNTSDYLIEFRDETTHNLLGSFTLANVGSVTLPNNLWRYRNFTLALKGLPGATGAAAQGVFKIDHY